VRSEEVLDPLFVTAASCSADASPEGIDVATEHQCPAELLLKE
jgi:hypothetical protein